MPADAAVAEQKIKFPGKTDLLNTCRKKCEEITDRLYPESGPEKKHGHTDRKQGSSI